MNSESNAPRRLLIVEDDVHMAYLLGHLAAERIDAVRALSLGADDYLTKPFSPAELVARIRRRLKSVPTAPERPTHPERPQRKTKSGPVTGLTVVAGS